MTTKELIHYYELQQHPEGGFYRQTYRSEGAISVETLPHEFRGDRHFSTAIYFLVLPEHFSAFHRLHADELWHFYSGGCLHLHVIHPSGEYELKKLGNEAGREESFQILIPAGCWFAAECAPGSDFSFTGCTMAPGFDFEDFELAEAGTLSAQYPQHNELIRRLCRQ